MTRGLIQTIMETGPVIPVLTISNPDHAIPLARALVAGGLKVLEITLRTACATDAIKAVADAVPDAIVGAGTIRTPDDLSRVAKAGAHFAISPGLTRNLAQSAQDNPVPLIPGVATASEIMQAVDFGFSYLKFFPAQSAGGLAALKSFAGPFPDIRFCPTGGITRENAADYLALSTVLCVGGSWVAPRSLVEKRDWAAITALATQASRLGSL